MGNNDLWIVVSCLELRITLVSNNEKAFLKVNQVNVENWV